MSLLELGDSGVPGSLGSRLGRGHRVPPLLQFLQRRVQGVEFVLHGIDRVVRPLQPVVDVTGAHIGEEQPDALQ
ncbi:hypothetical protein SDC9_112462 [bioreactor metagenome]|uniref:Uncharacterized protein n=1 Tax=bioreactor metagenome TaxID=1076179 RepID=A0A645BJK2_9ZZZZ